MLLNDKLGKRRHAHGKVPRKIPRLLLLVVALLALLVLLATLQYRWMGQISQAERERMQASLHTAVSRFRQDFDREITRASVSFNLLRGLRVETKSVHWVEEDGDTFAAQYARWTTSAPHPRIVRDLYLVDMAKEGEPVLSRFNPLTNRFESSQWPSEFARLQRRFEEPPRSVAPRPGIVFGRHVEPIIEEIPALLIPLPEILAAPVRPKFEWMPPQRYLVIRLDQDYLREEFIPVLARHYFSSDGRLDFHVMITNRKDSEKVVYRSDPNLSPEEFASSDAATSLFGFRPEEFIGSFHEAMPRTETRQEGTRRSSDLVTFQVFSPPLRAVSAGIALKDTDEGVWQLKIKHRVGSLDEVVGQVRRRNLIISFSVLLLLGGSMLMLIVSTHRSQRLAQQQIEFVAGVSHELRTPLAVICSAAENLEDGVIGDPQQVKRYGTLIKNESHRLREMVEQVLEFSGTQSGRKSYEVRPVQIHKVIDNALEALQSSLSAEGFHVEVLVEPDLPDVMADRTSLRNALQNLLGNAMKYSGESRWIGIQARTEAGQVRITVEDRGLGIDFSDLPHIFEPFYRGKEVIDAQIHGNGLGLSLVRHTIESQGGKITVQSQHGQGSAFTLHLPVSAKKSEVSSQSREAASEVDDLEPLGRTGS